MDKNFIVIGGSKGIGFEISRQLSEKQYTVIVISRLPGEVNGLSGVRHISVDVTREAIPRSSLPEKIQGIAYCPGSIRLLPFHRLSTEDFMEDMRINLLGAVTSIQACLPGLRKAEDKPGSIVLFSTVAVNTGMPFHASVASAKGAIEGLTRSLAAELAPRIRVNAVAPSLTETPLSEALLSDEKKREVSAQRHPLKRIGSADDAAAAAVFLLDRASSWMTGQVLSVDGGMGALRTFK
jgi:NAD(P)-dependent dehydrogenase (short-subunit alcohol dehydrogenase family)